MRAVGSGLILALALLGVRATPAMNEAERAMTDLREQLRHSDPISIVRNATQLLASTLPQELISAKSTEMRQMAVSLFRNLTHPSNVRTFLRLVRESKIRNKGDIIRMTMSFMNPDNRQPPGMIKTLKTLDTLTVSELSSVFLQYFKVLEPQILGHSNDRLLKYMNDQDIKEITRLFFDIFKETDSEDLLWMIERFEEEKKNVADSADQLLHAESTALMVDWQENGEHTLRQKVQTIISDSQKVSSFEKASSRVPELTEAYKKAAIHFIDSVIQDIEDETSDIDPKDLMGNLTVGLKQLTKLAGGLLEYIDVDEIGSDAEDAVNYVKKLDHHAAKQALESFKQVLPPVDKIIEQINRNDNILLKKVEKSKIIEVLLAVNNTKVPDAIIDLGIDSFLFASQKVDAKKVRTIVEVLAKESSIDNEVYKASRAVALNIVKDGLKKYPHIDLTTHNWKDLKAEVAKGITAIDGQVVSDLVQEVIADVRHLNASLVADVVSDANTVLKDVLSDDLIQKGFDDPKSLFDSVNKTVFSDMVFLGLDVLKVVNETQFSRRCSDFAELAGDDLTDKVNNITDWIKDQYARVENGTAAANKLKINEISSFMQNFLQTYDLKGACSDGTSMLKVNKFFNKAAREEVVEILWKAFLKVKTGINTTGIDKATLEDVQEALLALHRAIVRSGKYKADDFRAAAVRLAIRRVKDYARKGNYGWKLTKTESEEETDNPENGLPGKVIESLSYADSSEDLDDETKPIVSYNSAIESAERLDFTSTETPKKPTTTAPEEVPHTNPTTEAPKPESTTQTSAPTSTIKAPSATTAATPLRAATTTPEITTQPSASTSTTAAAPASAATTTPKSGTQPSASTTAATPGSAATTTPNTQHIDDFKTAQVTTSSSAPRPTGRTFMIQRFKDKAKTTTEKTVQLEAAATMKPPVLLVVQEPTEKMSGSAELTRRVSSSDGDGCAKYTQQLVQFMLSSDSTADQQWQAKMLDVSIQLAIGQDKADARYLAKKRECFSIKPASEQFSGKFCTASATISLSSMPTNYKGMEKLFEKQAMAVDWGVCIPSSCSAEAFNAAFQNLTLPNQTPLSSFISLSLKPESCVVEQDQHANKWDKAAWIIVGVLSALVLLNTLYELKERFCNKNDNPNRFFCIFSLQSTGKQLFGPQQPEQWFPAVDGLRSLGLGWVILNSTFAAARSNDLLNDSEGGMFEKQARYMVPMDLYAATDVLLVSLGLMTARSFLRAMHQTGRVDLVLTAINKLFRVVPPLAAVMLLRGGLLRSPQASHADTSACSSSWWQHILFIQNFMDPDKLCVPQGWYVSLEMQLFLASPLLLYAMLYLKKLRWMLSIVLLVVFTALPLSILLNLDQSVKLFPNLGDEQFKKDLMKPYSRAIPWIVGLITGFFIYQQKESQSKIKLSTVQCVVAVGGALGLCLACVYGAAAFLDVNHGKWQMPLFLALSRLGLSLGIAFMALVCANGHGGWLKDILAAGVFRVLGRLSLGAFLMHVAVIELGLQRTYSVYIDDYSLLLSFVGNYCVSHLLAVALGLLVQFPAANLNRVLLGRAHILPLPTTQRNFLIKS